MPANPQITVVVPTFRRPEPLARCLKSLLRQAGAPSMEIVVVDNAPEGGAADMVDALARTASHPLRCVSAPQPGVATARNRGIAEAKGTWVAFLDDDEEAGPGWLAALMCAAKDTGADAVFGPVDVKAEDRTDPGALGRYFGRRLDVPDLADIGDRAAYLGTNNSMFHRERCLAGIEPFDVSLNRHGGEDSLLLKRLRLNHRRFAWAEGARVTEWIPPRRLTWRYVWKRRYLSGQIRSFVHVMVKPPQWGSVAVWMAVGAIQAVAGGIAALLLWPVAIDRARHLVAIAAGGLGKVLWQRPFRPGLYGTGLVS